MLTILRIQNIVLIESVEIHFGAGFHVLSGETGAGKSALLQALGLVIGAKADLSLLRQGTKQGSVEAVFSPRSDDAWRSLLEEAELSFDPDEPIVLRRELSASGKTRAFFNEQLITQTLLKQIGAKCIEIVGQQASYNMRSLSMQRDLLDLYGNLAPLLQDFQSAFHLENSYDTEWQQLRDKEPERVRQREIIERERDQLYQANLQEDEEQNLIAQHDHMQHAREFLEGLETLSHRMGGSQSALITLAQREKQALERLVALDPSATEAVLAMQRVQAELQEVNLWIARSLAKIEFDGAHFQHVEERLQEIHLLKKRYGPTLSAVIAYKETLDARLQKLSEADTRQMDLEDLLKSAQQETAKTASKLTAARKKQLKPFAEAMQKHLEPLNMPKVQVEIKCHPCSRSQNGDEEIEIFFLPNFGEKMLSIAESSGGELSRIHLAIHMVLSGKSTLSSLVFDEIDAHIGGGAATVVGKMLAHVSESTQVLCITHFPQVARYATHHLQIAKLEEAGRTVTKVKSLLQDERHHELARMMGGMQVGEPL